VVLKDVSGGHLEEWQGSERLGMAVVSLTQDTLMALEGNTLAQWLAAEASGRLACVRCHAMQVALAVHIACERWHVRCCMHIQPRRHATMTCRVIAMLQGLPRRSRMREGPT
jgi:late competence protein required for DNA uptake (superfamily II DNA/RNA helicase)